ncbi:UrcA family protein [Novosphingobium sp. BW1]|uniref:UrcA family protein n=1 Tax=Novosphingobium sp. BW1 TaxID=2592621 RepID=UPI0011DE7453|nr:UrcA family protein [Novosphingobium sp. BW1]TYC89954.1 UrcA family protein [Novosphingobium sp. BW1]
MQKKLIEPADTHIADLLTIGGNTMFKKTALFAAALVGPAAMVGLAATATPAAAAAAAAAQENIPTATVYYTDLDLSTVEGQETLERRLVKTARKVCRMDERAVDSFLPSSSSQACFREATQKVEGQIAAAMRDQETAQRYGG